MSKKFPVNRTYGYFLCIAVLTLLIIFIGIASHSIICTEPLPAPAARSYTLNVLLIPLDSRPPCTQFVSELGNIAGINIIIPPTELLDNYKQPADKYALREWLRAHAPQADAAIVSTDMLIHGGLVASRLNAGSQADADAVLALLKQIHIDNPQFKLYVFNIIPRLRIGDNDPNVRYQKDMLAYSVHQDQLKQFDNPIDYFKTIELEKKIPPDVIKKYNELYKNNFNNNIALIKMVEQGTISSLVIGQDDGEPFGLPNLTKKRLMHYLQDRPELTARVFVTRGTDEVALTMLGNMASRISAYHPRVFIAYSSPDAPHIVMPFMPNSVETTIKEKIAMLGGTIVELPGEADYVLFVHVGTRKTIHSSIVDNAAEQIKKYVEQGCDVAVVDLTEDFWGTETLFPAMIRHKVPLIRLAAYAGWNTTSNSVGTALAQATIFTNAQHRSFAAAVEQTAVFEDNLQFLVSRFLDDWYFQKAVQPYVNRRLKTAGIDPYNLKSHHTATDQEINMLLNNYTQDLFRETISGRPLVIHNDYKNTTLYITSITLDSHLPWDRTFELWLKPKLTFGQAGN